MKLFISYSRDDKAWVYELWRNLRDEAQHDAWIDRRLIAAADWWGSICESIEACECFIYIMTPKSVESIYCTGELEYALALNKPILPVMLKSSSYPAILSKKRVQYETLHDEMNMDKILLRITMALGKVSEAYHQGNYALHEAVRPDVPSPAAKPEHLFEVFAAAEEAASEGNISLAEQLFEQVKKVDPDGMGLAAEERIAEIKYEHDRDVAYQNVLKLALNVATVKGARSMWRVYLQKYSKYGLEYDPEKLAAKFPDITVPDLSLASATSSTTVPVKVVADTPAATEIVPVEDELIRGESPYARLTIYLNGQPSKINRIKLSFEEIEQILKRELPPSAYNHRNWWSNRVENQVHERGWLDAGWKVVDIHIGERTVNFVRTGEREQQYIAFFSALLNDMEHQNVVPMRKLSPSGVHWQAIGSFRDKENATIALLSFGFTRKKHLGIEFYIDTGDGDRNKAIFDAINQDSFQKAFLSQIVQYSSTLPIRGIDAINQRLIMNETHDVHFQRLNNNRASRMALYLQGAVTDTDESLVMLRQIAVVMMQALYSTLLTELPKTGEKYNYQS